MLGPIERYLLEKIKTDGSIHITLIDPEKVTASDVVRTNDKQIKEQKYNEYVKRSKNINLNLYLFIYL